MLDGDCAMRGSRQRGAQFAKMLGIAGNDPVDEIQRRACDQQRVHREFTIAAGDGEQFSRETPVWSPDLKNLRSPLIEETRLACRRGPAAIKLCVGVGTNEEQALCTRLRDARERRTMRTGREDEDACIEHDTRREAAGDLSAAREKRGEVRICLHDASTCNREIVLRQRTMFALEIGDRFGDAPCLKRHDEGLVHELRVSTGPNLRDNGSIDIGLDRE